MSRFSQHDVFGEDSGTPLKAKVKWFNPTKGFGFVSPEDGTADAFLHVSTLHQSGLQEIGSEAEILCQIGRGPRGPQVTGIVEVLSAGEPVSRPAPERNGFDSSAEEVELEGTVKWFKPDKGFGFVTADDSNKDVFVHKSVLRRCGLDELDAGQRVQMKVQDVPKGREATWINIL